MTEITITRGFLLMFFLICVGMCAILRALDSKPADLVMWRILVLFFGAAFALDWWLP